MRMCAALSPMSLKWFAALTTTWLACWIASAYCGSPVAMSSAIAAPIAVVLTVITLRRLSAASCTAIAVDWATAW